MNERIKELLNQTSAWGPGGATMDRYNFHVSDVEKFAELILVDLISEFDQSMTGEEDSVDYGLHLAKEIIKERFGVE
jgi:hypothetical protein